MMIGQPIIMLDVDDLALSVAGRTLLRSVTLRVRSGELWCVVGANGAGKTLFLHTLVGLRPGQSGRIALAGKPIEHWTLADAARVRGFVPQSTYHAFPMRVIDVVVMGRYPYFSRWQWEQEEDGVRADQALAAVGLADVAARDITTLSGGERQRVCIAALLAQDVALMLLDEPMAHLDLRHQTLVLRHLRQLAATGRAVMLSIHDLNLAQRFATHIMLFGRHGDVVVGAVEDVMNEAVLSDAFGCPVTRITAGERTLFLAA